MNKIAKIKFVNKTNSTTNEINDYEKTTEENCLLMIIKINHLIK